METNDRLHGIIAVSGHRPDKLGGYGNTAQSVVRSFALAQLPKVVEALPTKGVAGIKVRTGMALGWDQAIAYACAELGIPFDAYVPFEGYDAKWPIPAKRIYYELLRKAQCVVIVSAGRYEEYKLQRRNEVMVEYGAAPYPKPADLLLALWSGVPSGTANCIGYAEEIGVSVTNVWKEWLRFLEGAR